MLQQKIKELKENLLSEAGLVDDMISKSIFGIIHRDKSKLKEVQVEQEPMVNRDDRLIEKLCVELIAQYEPVARDLRLALMIIKMNKDLERVADHAVNICQSGEYLLSNGFNDTNHEIQAMAEGAMGMFRDSIKAFASEDVVLAKQVCERDNSVDEAGDQILKRLTDLMHHQKESIPQSLHIMRIAYNFERIADLSTNIAEEVIYIIQGEDVKHQH